MSLSNEQVANIVSTYGASPQDTGATAVQVALLTERVNKLSDHLRSNAKDHHSRVGLMRMVGQRKGLLKYLQLKDDKAYRDLIGKLGIRK
jgi:small subunit ribosomal protein S15